MPDPSDMSGFSADDQRIIEDLVKKQAVDFKSSCDKACSLFRVVTGSTKFEETALSSLVQYKVLVQVGGNLLSEMIRHGGQPAEILLLLKYQQRAMLLKGMTQANVKSSLIEELTKLMEADNKKESKV